jgi:inward rectifier potassium channel
MSKRRVPLADVIRVGAPRALLADMYVRIIERSWAWFVLALSVLIVCINAFFALLYLVGGDVIGGAEHGSFSDAFFFSVQAFSTIGFGGLVPQTTYANVLVTIETVVGMMVAALSTGIAFAKFARPRANLVFSEQAVVSRFDGVPALMIRVANARGLELVEAQMTLTLLRSYTSPEGHTMRRLHDLVLMRSSTPVFTLSWLVMHRIDAQSPLAGITPAMFADDEMMIIASMTGHDTTYSQTVHDRHLYRAETLRWGHRFVDVITNHGGNRVEIDFEHFHRTAAEG